MSIKHRVTILFGCLAAIYVIGTSELMRRSILPAFESLEADFATQDIERIDQYLRGELKRIDDFNIDWSGWTNLFWWIQGSNPDFVETNLTENSVPVLHMNFMFVIDPEYNLLWGEVWDLGEEGRIDIEDYFDLPFSKFPEIYGHINTSEPMIGLLNGPGPPMLLASRAVTESDSYDVVAGTLVMGRIMDDYFIREMEEQISLSINIWDLQEELPDRVEATWQGMQRESLDIFHFTGESQLRSFFSQKDIYGQPTLMVELEAPRRIIGIGRTTMDLAVALLAVSLGLFLLAIWSIFGRLILAPVSDLKTHIQKLRQHDDLSQHIDLNRSDEFGDMAQEFNALTDQLLESRRESEAAKQAAIAASEAKSNFLATMSHEIRTPMNGVLGMADLILRTRPLSTEQKHYANTITQSGGALLRILDDILDFSKIESGKFTLENIDFSLREFVEDSIELVAHEAQEKGLELILDVAPTLQGQYSGDVGRIRQMLLNLLNNAVKFTAEGHVCLRLTVAQRSGDEQIVLFEVEDTGVGIADSNKSKLFTSFSQEDASTTRRFGGTGLGLAITRRLAELMGGEAGFSSTAGEGSTFWLRLPLRQLDSSAPSQKNLFEKSSAILCLADKANTEGIKGQLEYWGVQAHEISQVGDASDLIDSIRAADGSSPILLFVDKSFLDRHTSHILKSLFEGRANDKLKLVVLCPLASVMGDAELKRLGMPAIVNKPVRLRNLRECFNSLLVHPVEQASPQSELELDDSGKSDPQARRVLLVEDNTVNVMVAENMLKKLSYEVTTACNGEEALELYTRGGFDIVLMDCSMPVMDGYETTRRIRELEADGNTEKAIIIALTANAMTEDRERCLGAGMDDYIAKPISMDQLSAKLQRQLN